MFVVDLAKKVGSSKHYRSSSQAIYHDLGIAGDDAGEFLDEIAKKFGTSFRTLNFDAYFPNDIDAFCYHIASIFGFRDTKRVPVSLDHIFAVIDRGEWFAPQVQKAK
jgi:hypothetical protein